MQFPESVLNILSLPIDPAAISTHRGLSAIKSIYITERLNEAFGFGRWFVDDVVVSVDKTSVTELNEENCIVTKPAMVVVKATMELLDYPWFRASAYGGNDNADLGDAYKGAVSDAISKMCAVYLGIGLEVYKGQAKNTETDPQKSDIETIVLCILNAENWDDLKEIYSREVRKANRCKDKDAINRFTDAKNKAEDRLQAKP